eukprot:1101282-Amorphochlora_amoeboformis.AAC.1
MVSLGTSQTFRVVLLSSSMSDWTRKHGSMANLLHCQPVSFPPSFTSETFPFVDPRRPKKAPFEIGIMLMIHGTYKLVESRKSVGSKFYAFLSLLRIIGSRYSPYLRAVSRTKSLTQPEVHQIPGLF